MQTGLYVMEMDSNPSPIINSPEDKLPTSTELYQNFPNPFNPSTNISFYLPKIGNVSLKIYDALGKQVDEVISGNLTAGSHTYRWTAKGKAAGVYFYQLKGKDFSITKKLLLIK